MTSKPPKQPKAPAAADPGRVFRMPNIEDAFLGVFNISINLDLEDPALPFECLKHSVTIARPEGSGDGRMIGVRVTVKSSEAHRSPVEVEAEAIVTLNGLESDLSEEDKDRHALMLAAPIAYGMVREQIALFTGRSPFPAVHLPMIAAKRLIADFDLILPGEDHDNEAPASS